MTAFEKLQTVMEQDNETSFKKAISKISPSDLEHLIEDMLTEYVEPQFAGVN